MASAKSSRSRASGVVSAGDKTQENAAQLSDKLKIFKADSFDPDSYVQSKCQSVNEKVVRLFLSREFVILLVSSLLTEIF